MSPLKIAIVGAGPVGCTLAILLAKTDCDVTLFEGEANIDVRSQGGTLDLREGGGLQALREAGLFEAFQEKARYDGQALIIADKKFVKFMQDSASDPKSSHARPEIDRAELRKMLFDALPKDVVSWGHRLRKVTESADGGFELHFDHRVASGFDLVVGADGAWSKVRPVLTDVEPHYAGISGLQGSVRDAERSRPDMYKLVNRGNIFSYSDGKALMTQQLGDGSLSSSCWCVGDEDAAQKAELGGPAAGAELKELFLAKFEGWDARLREFIEAAAPDSVAFRGLHMLPVGTRWESRPGVTLMGDAAHLMTPFAGLGVNLGMTDAVRLAHAIQAAADAKDSKAVLDQKVKEYEKDMFNRARKAMELTDTVMTCMFFTPGAPRTVVARIGAKMVAHEMNSVLLGLLSRVLFTIYFFFFNLFH